MPSLKQKLVDLEEKILDLFAKAFSGKAKASDKTKDMAVGLLSKPMYSKFVTQDVYNFFKQHIFEAKDARLIEKNNRDSTRRFLIIA